ncbi:MAG: GNAT family N-acetyltransferase [Oscillospiraceae bacterium]|nr:GNAT family N-acetyltransferase [Oscillospiraceae bacterium]
MFLETERLCLRKICEADFDAFCSYAMDDEMSRMMGNVLHHTREDARLTFDWLKDKEERCYVLILKETGTVIGHLTVCKVPAELTELDALREKEGRSMSFCISRHHRRRGLMEEAVRAVIARLFDEGMDYVQCGYLSFNDASSALQKKLGFVYLTTQCFEEDGEEIIAVENILWKK